MNCFNHLLAQRMIKRPKNHSGLFYKNGAQNPLVWNSQWDVSDKRYDKLTL